MVSLVQDDRPAQARQAHDRLAEIASHNDQFQAQILRRAEVTVVRSTVKAAVPASVRRAIRDRQWDRRLVHDFFDDQSELDRYRGELRELWLHIEQVRERFHAELPPTTARGRPLSFGMLAKGASGRLYSLIRKLQPQELVETGVCNGVSTSVILLALEHNGSGRLWSIDYPEYSDGSVLDFSDTKGGAVVPAGKQPGWMVPDHLRHRWELTIGKSQEQLPPLLERLGSVDYFMHDSEHSYECMRFEMGLAADHLKPNSLLVVDDSSWNTAFADFAQERRVPTYKLGGGAESAVMVAS
jgi:hypothetical protein